MRAVDPLSPGPPWAQLDSVGAPHLPSLRPPGPTRTPSPPRPPPKSARTETSPLRANGETEAWAGRASVRRPLEGQGAGGSHRVTGRAPPRAPRAGMRAQGADRALPGPARRPAPLTGVRNPPIGRRGWALARCAPRHTHSHARGGNAPSRAQVLGAGDARARGSHALRTRRKRALADARPSPARTSPAPTSAQSLALTPRTPGTPAPAPRSFRPPPRRAGPGPPNSLLPGASRASPKRPLPRPRPSHLAAGAAVAGRTARRASSGAGAPADAASCGAAPGAGRTGLPTAARAPVRSARRPRPIAARGRAPRRGWAGPGRGFDRRLPSGSPRAWPAALGRGTGQDLGAARGRGRPSAHRGRAGILPHSRAGFPRATWERGTC